MDQRTIRGKKYAELQSHDEKLLFLLESIDNNLDKKQIPKYLIENMNHSLNTLNKIVRLNTEAAIFLMKNNNSNSVICDKYGKDMENRAKQLGIAVGWSSYGTKKW